MNTKVLRVIHELSTRDSRGVLRTPADSRGRLSLQVSIKTFLHESLYAFPQNFVNQREGTEALPYKIL